MAPVCLKSHSICSEPGSTENKLEMFERWAERLKLLGNSHALVTPALPSHCLLSHYNQLHHLDDFSAASGASEMLMKKVLEIAQKDQRPKISKVLVSSWASVMPAAGTDMKEVQIPSSHPTGPACCHPSTTGSLTQVLHITLPFCFLWLDVWLMQGGIVSIFTYKLKMY